MTASDDVNPISLRRATLADAEAIGALHVASSLETYTGLLPDTVLGNQSVEGRTAMWRHVLADPAAAGNTALFVAEDRGRMIGFGGCGRQRDEALAAMGYDGEIGVLYVLRAHQQKGAGRALMATMARALSDQGHKAASLWVLRENLPACRFYEALGGLIVAEKSDESRREPFVELAYGWRELSSLGVRP